MRRSNRAFARSDANAEPRRGCPGSARHMQFRPRWPLSRLISCATCEELRQAVLLELASDCQRQFSFADELHHARNLVGCKLTALIVCQPGQSVDEADLLALCLVDIIEHDFDTLANLDLLITFTNDARREPWSLVQFDLHDVIRRFIPERREPCLVNHCPGTDAPAARS